MNWRLIVMIVAIIIICWKSRTRKPKQRRCKDCVNIKRHRCKGTNFITWIVGECKSLSEKAGMNVSIDKTGTPDYYKCNAYKRKRRRWWAAK